ncbi:DUF1328 domain-containing protein [Aquabacter sp. P-9]|uniref:DUF1328 domain-containing protein n=1 Tax=Aquabacter sediminis TaxID=3029197 RepID=UPI00237E0A78|nr:DUF1328 family protein [Aquabacter sp. P-9]MDE1566919.1 DUF1328 domain-containing protein [Aquabacter sp. P-9]
MLKYAVIFLIISVIAGALGFMNISALARRISLILFGLFLGLALLVLMFFLLLDKVTDQQALLIFLPHVV